MINITIDNKHYIGIELEKLQLLTNLIHELTLPQQQHEVAIKRFKEIFEVD